MNIGYLQKCLYTCIMGRIIVYLRVIKMVDKEVMQAMTKLKEAEYLLSVAGKFVYAMLVGKAINALEIYITTMNEDNNNGK